MKSLQIFYQRQKRNSSFPSYLIYSIVSVPFLGAVFTVLASLAAAYYSNWFACLPVFGFCSIFVIDRDVAVESQRPDEAQKQMIYICKGRSKQTTWKLTPVSFYSLVIPVHMCKCLIAGLLRSPLVSRQISPTRASVGELITIIL